MTDCVSALLHNPCYIPKPSETRRKNLAQYFVNKRREKKERARESSLNEKSTQPKERKQMLNLVQTNQTTGWLVKEYKAKQFHWIRDYLVWEPWKRKSVTHTHTYKGRKKSKNGIYFFSVLFDEPTNKRNCDKSETLTRSNRHTSANTQLETEPQILIGLQKQNQSNGK